jgi:hypothetical protein
MSGLGGRPGKGPAVPNEGILRSARVLLASASHYLEILACVQCYAPLKLNAFLQGSADRLFLRRSAGGYTFHQVIRDYFGKYYDDPPHARSAVRTLKALVRLSP